MLICKKYTILLFYAYLSKLFKKNGNILKT